jgi:hypothetical protein
VSRRARRTTAQQRTDARDEFANAEGLRQIIVRAAFETEHLVGFLAARGQHQNRDVAIHRLATHGPAHRHPVELRQHHVENQQIERIGLRQPEAGCAVAGRHRRQTLELKVQHHQIANVRVVFDDEHSAARLSVGV